MSAGYKRTSKASKKTSKNKKRKHPLAIQEKRLPKEYRCLYKANLETAVNVLEWPIQIPEIE